MIEYVPPGSSLFDADVEAIVNTINTEGVMGGGIALDFKERFPEMFDDYTMYCHLGQCKVGLMHIWDRKWDDDYKGDPWLIVNFPTKDKIREPSKLEYIEEGLKDLNVLIDEYAIKTMAMPALGCGLGGLKWDDVKPLIEKYLSDSDCKVQVFEPQ